MKIKKLVIGKGVDPKVALKAVDDLVASVPQHTRDRRIGQLYNLDDYGFHVIRETETAFLVNKGE